MQSMVEGHGRDSRTSRGSAPPTVPLHHPSGGPPPPMGEDRARTKSSGGQPGSMGPSHKTRITRPERRFAANRRGAARADRRLSASARSGDSLAKADGALSPHPVTSDLNPDQTPRGLDGPRAGRVRLKVETLPLAAWGQSLSTPSLPSVSYAPRSGVKVRRPWLCRKGFPLVRAAVAAPSLRPRR